MVMLLPGIGDTSVPARVRLILALAISLALAPTVTASYPQQAPATALALSLLIAQEVTAGVLIGTMARIIMSALTVAGSLIAVQTGLSMAETLDPTSKGEQGAVVGNFLSLLGVVLIFATNMHHLAIGAIAGSYHLIPPGTSLPTGDMAELAIRLVSGAFALGFQLAAPFLVFGFAVNASFGVLSRMMPQLQVFLRCHAGQYFRRLRADGLAAWFDDDALSQFLLGPDGGVPLSHGRRSRPIATNRRTDTETARRSP